MDQWQERAEKEIEALEAAGSPSRNGNLLAVQKAESETAASLGNVDIGVDVEAGGLTDVDADADVSAHADGGDKQLVRMGLNTALAIAIHNFPEGEGD